MLACLQVAALIDAHSKPPLWIQASIKGIQRTHNVSNALIIATRNMVSLFSGCVMKSLTKILATLRIRHCESA